MGALSEDPQCSGTMLQMLFERMGALEDKMGTMMAAAAHVDEHKPKGAELSGLAHCAPPARVIIKKCFDGPLRHGAVYMVDIPSSVLDNLDDVFPPDNSTTVWDGAMGAWLGAERFAEMRAAAARIYASHDPEDPPVIQSDAMGCHDARHDAYDDHVLEGLVRHHVPELLAVGPYMMLIKLPGAPGSAFTLREARLSDLMHVVRRVMEVLRKPFPDEGTVTVWHAVCPKLAACMVRENDSMTKAVWSAMSPREKRAVRADADEGGMYADLGDLIV